MSDFFVKLFVGFFDKFIKFRGAQQEKKQKRIETPIEADKASKLELKAVGERVKAAMKKGDRQ